LTTYTTPERRDDEHEETSLALCITIHEP